MRMPFPSALLIAVAAAVTAGCASAGTSASNSAATSRATSPATSPASPGSPGSASPSSVPASPPPSSPGRAFACGPSSAPVAGAQTLTLANAEAGKTYCVGLGTNVLVFLRGTPAAKWGPIRASGSALEPWASGRMTLMIGVTGASFRAVRPGTSVIFSARPACGSSATPGDMPCDAVGAFRVTVIVRAG